MYAHRIETTIKETGTVKLDALPFVPGDKVEIIILKQESAEAEQQSPLSFAEATQVFRGKIKQAPADLSTNSTYLQDFGK